MARQKSGRPKKEQDRRLGVQIGLRVKDDLALLLDKKASELETLYPGSTWSRNDVVRFMLYRAFELEEALDDERLIDASAPPQSGNVTPSDPPSRSRLPARSSL